ncbi:MAG: hypothetical protein WCO16_01910 [bacterium]
MEKPVSLEALEAEIRKKVEEVKARAISLKDARKTIKAIDKLLYAEDGDHDEELLALHDILMDSTVTVQTLIEFKMVMQNMTDDPEQVEEMIAHENSHANVAESLGAKFIGYALLICKDKDDFVFRGVAPYELPPEWAARKRKAAHLKIIGAPEKYGEELSDTDIGKIEWLKRQ